MQSTAINDRDDRIVELEYQISELKKDLLLLDAKVNDLISLRD